MKKATLYLFMITYSTVMFKPAMPVIKDFAAHLFFYQDHMLNVHAHNGKFHVHAEVAEGAKNDSSDRSTHNLKKDIQGDDHIVIENTPVQIHINSVDRLSSLSVSAINLPVSHDFPPPKV